MSDSVASAASLDDDGFPAGFFRRTDETPDAAFYGPPRLLTHIDDRAIAAVGAVYEHVGVQGRVLDLMSSWISHFRTPPAELMVLGMNASELAEIGRASCRERVLYTV